MDYKIIENSPFLKNLFKNLTTHLLSYLIVFIFLVTIQYYYLKKDLVGSIVHSFLIAGLISL
jgi:hypothetical protein